MRCGTIVWKHATPHGLMASSPAVADNEIVYHSMEGHVFVLDRANGKVRWEYRIGSAIEASPIVRDGVDYFGAWNGRLYAPDPRTHRLRRSRMPGANITSRAPTPPPP